MQGLKIVVCFSLLVGKFPHLMASVSGSRKTSELSNASEVILNFGEVPVQSTANKWIELHNFSPVSNYNFSLVCVILILEKYQFKALQTSGLNFVTSLQ